MLSTRQGTTASWVHGAYRSEDVFLLLDCRVGRLMRDLRPSGVQSREIHWCIRRVGGQYRKSLFIVFETQVRAGASRTGERTMKVKVKNLARFVQRFRFAF